jgi:hypothetical protein
MTTAGQQVETRWIRKDSLEDYLEGKLEGDGRVD